MNKTNNHKKKNKTKAETTKVTPDQERWKKILDAEKFARHQNEWGKDHKLSDRLDAEAWRNEG